MPLFGPPSVEKLKGTRDVAALIKALAHKDAQIRRGAATALGELGGQRAVKPKEKLL